MTKETKLSEYALSVLKANKIDPSNVQDVSGDMIVTMKDGKKHRICEVWTRVMGYFRPKSEFNVGKRQEHDDRKLFEEPKLPLGDK